MKIFHPLLALIASSTESELAKYVQYLKEENKILRARIPGQIHTTQAEREKLLKLGKVIGRAIEELTTVVKPKTFYRWLREEKNGMIAVAGAALGDPTGGASKQISEMLLGLVNDIEKLTEHGGRREFPNVIRHCVDAMELSL